jgi:signal transduction histidine kinase
MGANLSIHRIRLGLGGKLILAILVAGSIPIVVGLSATYFRGNAQLIEVIGGSFRALAKVSAAKIDGELLHLITGDRELAELAAEDPGIRKVLLEEGTTSGTGRLLTWMQPTVTRKKSVSGNVLDSWITGMNGNAPRKNPPDQRKPDTTTVSRLRFDEERKRYVIQITTPIHERDSDSLIGFLHRAYDAKKFLDPLVYPIRFGITGHVMVVDNRGVIVSCPLLITGSRITDEPLIAKVVRDEAGWITAESDGHGGQKFSLVGHAPLEGINSFLEPGTSLAMFVWQDSEEIFAPGQSLLMGVGLAGVLAIALLGILGYYASNRIVNPIRRLRQEASHIAAGELKRSLTIRTGDEIEELAEEFNSMRVQLDQFISSLEEKVEERTHKLKEAQAEKERVMDQLIQAEKMTAIGTMASGVGHEINNPLYAILGTAEAIRDEEDIARCREYSKGIIKYSKEIAEIVKNISGYVQPGERHDLQRVDVNERLSNAVALAKLSILNDSVEIRQDMNPIPEVLAKSEEIQQALFNIIRNGIQAINGKGILEVASHREGDRVSVRIRDTGKGIPKDIQGKIFDPFFTTKGPDEGEGLGLYVVQQIITKYNGTIDVETEDGVGTVFTIQLPIAD